MEENNTTLIPRSKIIWRNAIAITLLFAVVLILTDMFKDQMMEKNNLMSVIYMVVLFGTIIFTQIQVREQSLGGIMSFSKAFGTGMLLALAVALMFGVFNFIFYTVISPDTLSEANRMAETSMREKGNSQEEIDMAMKFTGFMFTPVGILISTIIFYPLFGMLLSLVASLFTQRNR
ncbi:MAG: DUF4199 domain-containing protein [Chitinophagales bacterium]|nr:DUF4199 domain-containing protein [Bacteroidota bacterium]MBP7400835.1 DUF4199 domain-containing protein [Chitinophagales bacterium]MBK8681646.1 DUF4199 domain-containing protein [Bacteroidota bacterium]MBP8754587.1 DUF4199 domain-containing protein [Chitinophagales bacterium]MBP9190386.1 DUF4199 domain-containing protein [Chitinophagales bacterium]